LKSALPEDESSLATILGERLESALQWKIDPRRDLRAGDEAKIVYNPQARSERVPLYGFWYKSRKTGKEYFYIYFPDKTAGDASFFDEQGQGISGRIERPPLPEDALMSANIRPLGKNGVSFSVPRGTTVIAPFPARVTRLNWEMDKLGRSVEIRYLDSGAFGQFCNLENISDKLKEGSLLTTGMLIGTSGSSGQTTYSRLLYRVEKESESGERIAVDPYEIHGRKAHELPAADRVNFLVAFAKVVKLFGEIAAPRANGAPD